VTDCFALSVFEELTIGLKFYLPRIAGGAAPTRQTGDHPVHWRHLLVPVRIVCQ